MDCLSAEDLKEERNCSLTRERTLNPHTCPAARMAFANWRNIAIALIDRVRPIPVLRLWVGERIAKVRANTRLTD